MSNQEQKSAAKSAAKRAAKASAKSDASPYDKGPIVEVYNNMRCAFIMPRKMLTHVLKAEDVAPLSSNVLYSKKARVTAGGCFRIKRGALDEFLKNNVAIKNFFESKCLKIIGKKDRIDSRDAVDATHKIEPSEDDMRDPEGKTLSVIQTEAVELKVNESRPL